MEGHRIVSGRLDCPNCEDRHPIEGGIVRLVGAARTADTRSDPGTDASGRPELAELSAALLGPPAGPEVLLVGPGLGSLAFPLAELRPEAWVISYAAPPADSHERVHWVAPVPGAPLPIRSARIHGVVLTGGVSLNLAEAARVLVPGGRLLILAPGPRVSQAVVSAPIRELVADSRAWLGVRT